MTSFIIRLSHPAWLVSVSAVSYTHLDVYKRQVKNLLAGLFRIHAGDEAVLAVGIFLALFSVELARLPGDALGNDFGILVDQNGHVCSLL